ncbi:shikimate dehydrogenase family protein [Amnibacterium flavum]|uniref:shikimate dehydrogenase family protein n=1 Tax=Amnibacterium flavum TaxID=2173173 RepID=UPI001F0CBB14|nr:shikimate dehydrogenase [Amnibacterium flavum]
MTAQHRLAVLGSPIAHSRSPLLHSAAYEVLGLDWRYERIEVGADALGDLVRGLGPEWRGLSLTMPLKEAALPVAARMDDTSRIAGAGNTVVFDEGGPSLWNTDVEGIVGALRANGVGSVDDVVLLGTGATARSALLALARLGARFVMIAGRTPANVDAAVVFAVSQGLESRGSGLDFADWPGADLVVSTLPAAAGISLPGVATSAALFDAAYGDRLSTLAQQWTDAGGAGRVTDGVDMLVRQALLQVRAFVGGSPAVPLEREEAVLRAMLAAVGRS